MTRFALALLLTAAASAAEPALTFDLTLVEASGDAPMIVMWVEKSDGSFVKTLQIFSKDHCCPVRNYITKRYDGEIRYKCTVGSGTTSF